MNLLPKVEQQVHRILEGEVAAKREQFLQVLIDYTLKAIRAHGRAHLNFICTHNSRRSQLSQVWAHVAAAYYNLPVSSYSGGVEVTACNERTVASLERFGFDVQVASSSGNPQYELQFAKELPSITVFSKLYADERNPQEHFSAVMTCTHADDNCPFIQGAEARIPLRYSDPKEFDGTALEEEKYDERSSEIARELFYIFEKVASQV